MQDFDGRCCRDGAVGVRMTRRAQTMTCTRQRAIRLGFHDLEGRQLLSTVLPGDETSPPAPAIATFKGQKYIA